MRVTDRALFESSIARNGAARERHAKATAEASTGLKVQHPWDSSATPQITRYRLDADRMRAINGAVGAARGDLDLVDGTLAGVVNVLQRGGELAVQLANDTYNAADRASAAAEVRALRDEVLRLANIESAGRYLLSGTAEGTRPFDAAGSYQGDAGERRIELAPGSTEVVSFRGDEILGTAAGGIDVLAALDDLALALEADDTAAIRTSIDAMHTGVGQVAVAQSKLGGVMLGLEIAEASNRTLADVADERRAELTDADFIEAATNLAFAERALEASFAATAKSFGPSLLDVLR